MIYATSLLARSSTAVIHIKDAQQRVLDAQYDVASGTSVTVGSDDPVAAGQALRMRASLSRIDTWIANIDLAEGRQNAMDDSLQAMSELFSSAATIANQGASSATSNSDSLAALSSEVEALITQLKSLSNSEAGGSYFFGGTASGSPPFTFAGDVVTYQGTTDAQEVAISSTQSTEMTLPGHSLLLSPLNAFEALTSLRDALSTGDTATVSTLMDTLRDISTNLYKVQTKVGASTKSMESVRSVLDSISITTQTDLSTAADTDMAEASVRLSAANVAYEAALQVATKIASPTLLDFL